MKKTTIPLTKKEREESLPQKKIKKENPVQKVEKVLKIKPKKFLSMFTQMKGE